MLCSLQRSSLYSLSSPPPPSPFNRPLSLLPLLQHQPYSSLPFNYAPITLAQTTTIKQDLFGQALENFKKVYEEPIAQIYEVITSARKNIGNRRARTFVKKYPTNEKRKKREELRGVKDFAAKEKVLEDRLHKMISNFKSMKELRKEEFFLADTPERRMERDQMIGVLWENFTAPSMRPAEPSDPPPMVTLSDGLGPEIYKYERTLSEGELAGRLEEQLRSEAVIVNSDQYDDVIRERLEKTNYKGSQIKKLLDLPKNKPELIPDRPAVLFPQAKQKLPKKQIHKVSDEYPIAFETNHYPTDEIADPYHTRKVTMYLKLSALELPPPVRKRFIGIANYKGLYNSGKDILKITSRVKRTMRANKHHIVNLLRAMLTEAWKVDLNYIPGKEHPLPHEIIQTQLLQQKEHEQRQYTYSFDRIKEQQSWTIFRLLDLPSDDQWGRMCDTAERDLQSILKEIETIAID